MYEFKVIYKILSMLLRYDGMEDVNISDQISPESLRVSEAKWEQLLIKMQDDGLIVGLETTQTLSDRYEHVIMPITPHITMKGMQYLEENSMMTKAKNLVMRGIDKIK